MRSLSTKMASPCRSCASSTWGICCANPKISPCASFARPQRPPGPLRAHARGHADGGERRLLRASWLDGAATRRPRRASLNDHRSTPRLGNSWVPWRRQGPSGTHPRGHQLGRAFSSARSSRARHRWRRAWPQSRRPQPVIPSLLPRWQVWTLHRAWVPRTGFIIPQEGNHPRGTCGTSVLSLPHGHISPRRRGK
jgi:hypothetical protein